MGVTVWNVFISHKGVPLYFYDIHHKLMMTITVKF